MVKSLLFTAAKVPRRCLQAVDERSEVLAVIQAGPELKPLSFIADPKDFFADRSFPFMSHEALRGNDFGILLREVDIIVSVGYGRIIPKRIFSVPPHGAINLHPAYLPEYRGKHPDIYAIMNGDAEAGITLHYIDDGIDSGEIISQHKIPIGEFDTIVTITEKLHDEGAKLLAHALDYLNEKGSRPKGHRQRELVGSPLSTRIDWEDSAKRIHNLIRSLTYPWPMAYAFCGERKIYITAASKVEETLVVDPGQITAVTQQGVVVAAGVHQLLIEEIRLDDGSEVVSGSEIYRVIDVKVGDTLC